MKSCNDSSTTLADLNKYEKESDNFYVYLQLALSHSLEEVRSLLLPSSSSSSTSSSTGNCLPIWATLPADVLTPVIAYLRLTDGARAGESFLLESAVKGETAGRWSFVGASMFCLLPLHRHVRSWQLIARNSNFADPQKVYRSGPNDEIKGDPLVPLEKVLDEYKFIKPHGAPPFTGMTTSPPNPLRGES
jgi:anthranilate synthase component 1